MRTLRFVATLALLGCLVALGVRSEADAAVWRQVRPYVDAVRAFFAWPAPRQGEATLRVVELPPKVVELPPKVTVKKTVTKTTTVAERQEWITVCAPGGAFYVPKEVFDSGAVCGDHSLGVPLREAWHMSQEEFDARIEAIRQRYLAQQGH